MPKEMIGVGVGILAAIIPLLLPNLTAFFAYGLFAVAAILVMAGAFGLFRTIRRRYVKDSGTTIFRVTIRRLGGTRAR